MTELVERYVHQVGRYLPHDERDDIQAELRSLIQDQLDDRFEGPPTPTQVAVVLTELGDPRQMAASYGSQQYLVGPDLYPSLMWLLRLSWVRVPAVVVLLNILWAVVNARQGTLLGLFFETLLLAVLATFMFSGVVVLIFALLQHSGVQVIEQQPVFDPLQLPPVDDPGAVDIGESAVGSTIGIFMVFVFIYFWHVGGLTLRFNLSDPGKVIHVDSTWLVLLIVNSIIVISLNVLALMRKRWTVGMFLIQTVIEVLGVIPMYFVVYEPVFQAILREVSLLKDVPLINWVPEVFTFFSFWVTLINQGAKLVRLWMVENSSPLPVAPADG